MASVLPHKFVFCIVLLLKTISCWSVHAEQEGILDDALPPSPTETGDVSRCYGSWGCLPMGGPFNSVYRPVNMYPIHPDMLNVHFLLMTRADPDHFRKLKMKGNSSFADSFFDPARPVKFIVHGYLEHGSQPWIKNMIRELLTKDNFNVISVDWVFGAAPPYTQAVANARMVGVVLGDFIKHLQDEYSVPLSDVHLIGHSLGAHVAGYAGEKVTGLGRITGLDPAEPYFQYTDPKVRLDPTDADFVDVIHTDGGSIIRGGLGMIQDCGHVDFYPNGGKRQPGCDDGVIGSIEKAGIYNESPQTLDWPPVVGSQSPTGWASPHTRSELYLDNTFLDQWRGQSVLPLRPKFPQTLDWPPIVGRQSSPGWAPHARSELYLDNTFLDQRMGQSALPLRPRIRRYIGCNHLRAYELFTESINNECPFYGYACDSYQNFTSGKCADGCGEGKALCAPMGYRADEWKNFAGPEPTKMFLQTGNTEPFCRHHYIVRMVNSNTNEAKKHGEEKGRLLIHISGSKGQTPLLEAKKEVVEFAPGRPVEFMVSWPDLGKLLRVDVEWLSRAHFLNPLRWRIFDMPSVYINRFIITNMETGETTVFCGTDEPQPPEKVRVLFTGTECPSSPGGDQGETESNGAASPEATSAPEIPEATELAATEGP